MANIPKTRNKSKLKSAKSAAKGDSEFAQAREQLRKKRTMRDRSLHWSYFWNVCPKCGGDMFEQEADNILFDVCRKCHGVYLDGSELELAMTYLDSETVLKGIARKSKKPKIDS